MLKFSGSSYLVSGQRYEWGWRASAPIRQGECLAIVRGSRVAGIRSTEGKVTGVVSERTYHTALLLGPPTSCEASESRERSPGCSRPFLKRREAINLVGLIDHGTPRGSVRGYDTETSMLHTKRHVRSKI